MNTIPPIDEPLEHEREEKLPFPIFIVSLLAVTSTGMFGAALFSMGMETGPLGALKTIFITLAAGLVTLGVNRTAIELGAPLAAKRFRLAGIASVAAMIVVGSGLYLATFTGLVNNDVAELEVQNHGTELVLYVGEENRFAAQSSRVGAFVRFSQTDLFQYAECEVQSSCVSNRGDGGRGTVAIVLEDLAGRANEIATQFEQGENARRDALSRINAYVADYQDILGDTDKGIWERRLELLQIDAAIDQEITLLKEAVPTSLLQSYAHELLNGVTIPARPFATRRMNEILKTHGRSLDDVLDTLSQSNVSRPVFSSRPGVLDVLGYAGDFAHIALITFVVELVMPITVWTMTFLNLVWEIEIEKRRREAAKGRKNPHDNGRGKGRPDGPRNGRRS